MFLLPSRQAAVAIAALLLAATAVAQTSSQVRTLAHPEVRITAKINNAVTMRLAGTHPAVVEQAAIGSRVAADTPVTHMRLLLAPTDEQEYALRSLLDEQQDKSSPNFHKWLTPETFGQHFGAAQEDISRVTAWLEDEGFAVEGIAKSGRVVSFSGTAGQVEAAFHTQMNHITVEGEAHISNLTDISIPQALSAVVRGIAKLNDFEPKSNAVGKHTAEITTNIPANNYITPGASPMYTSASSGAHYVGPGDAAVIFNSTPLLNAGIDGTGQTVAVLGRSNISLSDVQQFRSMFGLPKNDPTFVVLGNDPGLNGDDDEAFLDVEWAGAMAPKAKVIFVVAGPDRYIDTSGINAAGLYAVDNNIGDIITLSYGGCETNNGASGTAFWNTLWQQAAAQGQTVFISSGDSNATGCSSSSATYGTAYGVNALGSSAYNVAVGGTMFVDYGPSQYWQAGVTAPAPAGYTFTTATGYIPEAAWNQGALTTTYLNTLSTATQTSPGIVGTGGGLSIYTPRPAWQTGSGISGTADVPCSSGTCIAIGSTVTGPHRMVPDISFIAASGHAASIFCGEGVCSNTSTGFGIGAIGGTSVATPVMASVQALINQKNGGRQGNANYYYYPLANQDYVAGNCKAVNGTAASPTVTLPANTCNFHDVIAGDNRSQQNASDTTGLGFYSGAGFDGATGLGSVNIANVANNWSSVSFTATITAFTLTPTTGIAHGASQSFSVRVAASTASGTPSGDVSIIAETTNPSVKLRYTLSAGGYSGTLTSLPAGTYNVHAHYGGDGTFAASDSPSLGVNISQEASAITNTVRYSIATSATGTSTFTNATTIPYGVLTLINTQIAGATSSNATQPTGTVTYSVALNGSSIGTLVQNVDGFGAASFQSGAVYGTYYQNSNFPMLVPGSYVVTVSYSGDSTFTASSTTVPFTVTKGTPFVALTSSGTNISSGQAITLNYSVTRPTVTSSATGFNSLAVPPTGSVVFTLGATTLGTVSLNANGIASLTTTAIITAGANSVTATYSGDTLWATLNNTATITVGTGTATTTTPAYTAGTYYVGSLVPITATVSPAVAGTVTFYDNGVRLGSATSSATTGVATLTTTVLGTSYIGYNGFTAGAHTISATFAGTATYASSSGTAAITISQNVPSLVFDSPAASTYGQTVALAGRLTRSPTTAYPLVPPTAVVTFTDGGTAITTGTLTYQAGYSYYTALASVPTLSAGTHTLQAVFAGDANFASATSGTVTLTVAKLTPTVTISSATTVYAPGSPVTLTATIPLPAALTAPVSGVSFYDGATLLGTVTPTYSAGAYVASLTASALSGGSHTITAVLPSDANYNTATSAAFVVTLVANNVWVVNGNGSVSGVKATGAAITGSGVPGGGTGIAIDGAGNIWSLNKSANSITEFSSTGGILGTFTAGSLNAPSAVSIDGAGYIWVANGNGTLSVLNSAGAAVSTTAYSVSLSTPTSVNVDASGNLWITNAGDNSVTEVIGVASPLTTPTTNAVKNNALAAKP